MNLVVGNAVSVKRFAYAFNAIQTFILRRTIKMPAIGILILEDPMHMQVCAVNRSNRRKFKLKEDPDKQVSTLLNVEEFHVRSSYCTWKSNEHCTNETGGDATKFILLGANTVQDKLIVLITAAFSVLVIFPEVMKRLRDMEDDDFLDPALSIGIDE
ncbi:hypothetical protein QVD17_08569 [Tagetes erecta]|uniref:Uncharacterized protein n=1 Tax=Tagetes erecta TaxID=13708 RepID=A0AAD8L5X8_TARER|nr:hypothetical protein QVD17_08569 [Tagetes erecta]